MKKGFAITVGAVCLGYLALEWYNGRAQMADFRVYYDATNALLHGDTLYGKAFGVSSGFYKYSPFACLPFIPLAMMPYTLASVLYYLLITATIIFFSLRIAGYVQQLSRSEFSLRLPILAGIFLIDHLERELHLGNINLFLLVLLFEAYKALKSNNGIKGGVLYGIVLLFKPHFLLLLPYLLWKKQSRASIFSLGIVVLGILLPALAIGWNQNIHLVRQWLTAMSDHNMALQLSPNTIYGLINRIFLDSQAGSWLVWVILAVVAAAFIGFMFRNDTANKLRWSNEIRFTEFFLLVGLVPNLVHTDTEHFMWVWPMLALAIQQALNIDSPRRNVQIALLTIAFIPFAINTPDIVGERVRLLFDEGGLGIANLIILLVGGMVIGDRC
ncbi:MAG: glycosyltransferase family 87 protein [Flavobacteriales bacterium]